MRQDLLEKRDSDSRWLGLSPFGQLLVGITSRPTCTRFITPDSNPKWDFIVVRNTEAKRKIRDLLPPGFKAMREGFANDRPEHKSNDRRWRKNPILKPRSAQH
jgi:hypothetical protein